MVPSIDSRTAPTGGPKVLPEIIRREIQVYKVISFARFMDLALYHPEHGYYQADDRRIGKTGDYFTNVSVGKLFGELLAFQFAEWLTRDHSGSRRMDGSRVPTARSLQLVEAGAHDGKLAVDILAWLRRHRRELFDTLEYWIVEPSATRQSWQKNVLKDFQPRVHWLRQWPAASGDGHSANSEEQRASVCGVVFSNELLDALPVHRLGWDALHRCWFEWGVGWEHGRFVWVRMLNSVMLESETKSVPQVPAELAAVLPDGFTTEICPQADRWWREAAQCLRHGKLLTIDYGQTSDEMFAPQKGQGTLRAYLRHHATTDVLVHAGEQDLTAEVNFSSLQSIGEAVGLTTDGLMTQGRFLTRIAEMAWKSKDPFEDWTAEDRRQFRTLIHPEHLGTRFRVLVQSTG